MNVLSILATPVWCAVKAQAAPKNKSFAQWRPSFAEIAGEEALKSSENRVLPSNVQPCICAFERPIFRP
ncbi:hypothetical protein [Labrenzia sp. 011]|uniref:hypothetical protein n=1 Tax=Labrenzia sp. 011 TaxID=2171494 RepID=UPI0010570466|nr:hypothetical protein [Labrenzia sp. 011]